MDWASRVENIDRVGARPWTFQDIIHLWGYPEIDLFASRINIKCDRYCSWHRDPEAFRVDAFTLEWTNFKILRISAICVDSASFK